MLYFRYYLWGAVAILSLWWPIKYLISWFFFKRRVNKITGKLFAYDDYPLLGCALRFFGKNTEEVMDIVREEFFKPPTPFLAWLGSQCFMVVDHPEDIQTVMSARATVDKGQLYRFFNRGAGLFSAPYHIWKPQRKQLGMSFSNQICCSYLPIFNEKANILVQNVKQFVGKKDFDILRSSSFCTLDTVSESVLGSPMNTQKGENMEYMKSISDWLEAVARRTINIFLHPEIIYKLTQTHHMESTAIDLLDSMQEELIQKKMKEFEENDNGDDDNNNDPIFEEEENEDFRFETPQILIERLIKLRKRGLVSEQEIRDQVALMIFAGLETSSYTISMSILLLAMHPEYEKRVMDELNAVFGDSPLDCEINIDQLNALSYLEQVIKETLRVFPHAPLLLRHCTEDTKLRNTVIPKGAEVVISVLTAHRRKDVWGLDADKFNPDHFDKEVSTKRNPFAFMAFANGPRNCIGRRFAIMSMKIILAKLLRKYRFSTNLHMEDLKFRMEITVKVVNGIHVGVEERN